MRVRIAHMANNSLAPKTDFFLVSVDAKTFDNPPAAERVSKACFQLLGHHRPIVLMHGDQDITPRYSGDPNLVSAMEKVDRHDLQHLVWMKREI